MLQAWRPCRAFMVVNLALRGEVEIVETIINTPPLLVLLLVSTYVSRISHNTKWWKDDNQINKHKVK